MTQPNLSQSPRELLQRVQRGTVDIDTVVVKGMYNDDADPDNFPMENETDLAQAGQFVNEGSEYLNAQQKAAEDAREAADDASSSVPPSDDASDD